MKKFLVSLIGFVILLSASFSLAACNPYADLSDWEYIEARGKIVLGFDNDFPPMGFLNDASEPVGFDLDLAAAACEYLGVELELQAIGDWSKKEFELKSKNVDVLWNGLTMDPERAEHMEFTVPYLNNAQVVMVRKDKGYNSIADLASKNIGYQGGSTAENAVIGNEILKAANHTKVGKNIQAIQTELKLGTIDALVLDRVVAEYALENLIEGSDQFKILGESLASEEYAIGVRKGDTVFVEKLNEALRALKANGKMAEISVKWFGRDITTVE